MDRLMIAVEVLVGLAVVGMVVGKGYGAASSAAFVASGLAIAAAGYFLVRMMTALKDETLEVRGMVVDTERETLEHEKLLLLQGLKEFEADAATGKVDSDDYQRLRKTAEARAVHIIGALKAHDAYWLAKAKTLASKRLGIEIRPVVSLAPKPRDRDWPPAHPGLFDDRPVEIAEHCSGCGQKNPPDARFCIGCGRPKRVSS